MSKNRRSFNPEYKDEAAKMVIELSRPVASVARECGLNEGYAKPSLKKCRPIAARNEDEKVFSGRL